MGIFDPTAKDIFAAQTQSQNLGRLLLRTVQHVFFSLNSRKLLEAASEQWGQADEKIDRADIRIVYWQTARECRELILKALALIYFVESSGLSQQVDSVIELVGVLLDAREGIRKRAMEFNEVHWAPIGTAIAPQPPYAVEVALDVLVCGGSYPRLPVMMEDIVKQVDLPDPSIVLKLNDNERHQVRKKVETEVFSMWVLSGCPKSEAELRFSNGKILFEIPHEFRVTAIFDFQRCQILQAEILIGTSIGIQVSPLINLGFSNVLRQAVGLLEARHQFALEKIKRLIRETWRKLTRCYQRKRNVSLLKSVDDSKKADIELHLIEEEIMKCQQEITELEDELKQLLAYVPVAAQTEDQEIDEKTIGKCFDDICIKSSPNYFSHFFALGRYVCGGVLLQVLRDQILRAKNFPDVFPGGIFRLIEHGSRSLLDSLNKSGMTEADGGDHKGSSEIDSVKSSGTSKIKSNQQLEKAESSKESRFRALDVFCLSQFNHSCGGLLSPLLQIILENKKLFPYNLDSMLLRNESHESQTTPPQGPKLEPATTIPGLELSASADLQNSSFQLNGNGSILRFHLDDELSTWNVILWPYIPVLWLLNNSHEIWTSDDEISLRQYLQSQLQFDFDFVLHHLKKDPSWQYLSSFDARRLELSGWTQHTAAALSTLVLTLIAGCLINKKSDAIYTSDVDLRIGTVESKYTKSQNLSAQRSLRFFFFKTYLVQIHLQPFDGSLRIAFPSENSSEVSWVRLPGQSKPIDAEISASLRGCPAGIGGLVQILPFLKFLAFADLVRGVFLSYGLTETLHADDFKEDAEEESGDDQSLFVLGINNLIWKLKEQPTEKKRNVVLIEPHPSSDMTTTMQKLNRLRVKKNRLETHLSFAIDEWIFDGGKVKLLLNASIRNNWSLYSSHIVVVRVIQEDWSTIAHLKIHHLPYFLELPTTNDDNNNNNSHSKIKQNMKFADYWNIVNTAFAETSDRLHHIVAMAALSPAEFPFVVQTINVTDKNGLSFDCSPIRQTPTSSWAERKLAWRLDRCLNVSEVKSMLKELDGGGVQITASTTIDGHVRMGVTLRRGTRLPAFKFGHREYTEVEDKRILKMLTGTQVVFHSLYGQNTSGHTHRECAMDDQKTTDNEWYMIRSISYEVEDESIENLTAMEKTKFSKPLAKLYKNLFSQVQKSSIFLKGILEMQRVEVLRDDVKVSQALPDCLEVVWYPWDMRIGTFETGKSDLSAAICLPSLKFCWTLAQPKQDAIKKNTIEFNLTWAYLQLECPLLYTALNESKHNLCERLNKLESIWDFIRLIMSIHEFHSSIHLLTCINPYAHDLINGTKLAPVNMMITRIAKASGGIGNEILSFSPKQPKVSSPVPAIIDEIKLRLSILNIDQIEGKLSQSKMEPTFLCLTISASLTCSQAFQSASTIMNKSLQEMMSKLIQAFGIGYQSTPWLPLATTDFSISPQLFGLMALNSFPSHDEATINYQLYFWPGHFLHDFLIPFNEGLSVWLNSSTTAASVNLKHAVNRYGILILSRSPIAQPTDQEIKDTDIGRLTWKHALVQNISLNQIPPTPDNPDHSVSVALVPRPGDVLPNHWLPHINYQHTESENPILKGNATVSVCSKYGEESLLIPHQRTHFWVSLKKYLKQHFNDIQKKIPVVKDLWEWSRKFNVLLLSPSTLSHLTPFCQIDDIFNRTGGGLSYQNFIETNMQRWESVQISFITTNTKSEDISTSNKQNKIIARNQARTVLQSQYLDQYPDALILPYEFHYSLNYHNGEKLEAAAEAPADIIKSDETSHFCAKKRRRIVDSRVGENKKLKIQSEDDGFDAAAAAAATTTFQPPGVLTTRINWIPPLKPRGVSRADGKSLELKLNTELEVVTLPSMAEWIVFTKYFKLYSRLQAVGDFPLLVRFFQKSPNSNISIGDLSALLELVTVSNELHLKQLQHLTRQLVQYKGQLETPQLPISLPYLQLEFVRPPSTRPRGAQYLDLELRVWNCLPWCHQYLTDLMEVEEWNNNQRAANIEAFKPIVFQMPITFPLPPTEQTPILFNNRYNINQLLTLIQQMEGGSEPPCSPFSLPLSVQRPLSKALAKVFASGISFSQLQSMLAYLPLQQSKIMQPQ